MSDSLARHLELPGYGFVSVLLFRVSPCTSSGTALGDFAVDTSERLRIAGSATRFAVTYFFVTLDTVEL